MRKILFILIICFIVCSCKSGDTVTLTNSWSLSVLPSSVRLDPVTNEIIEQRFILTRNLQLKYHDILKKNQIFDGHTVSLSAARGEYVSFQLVLTNNTAKTLKGIRVEMPQFKSEVVQFSVKSELFLDCSVNVKTPSTGYPKASLGKGWYPDALIPFKYIQDDSMAIRDRWKIGRAHV